jgi:signal transduction histidine kinase
MYQHNYTQAEKYYLGSETLSKQIQDYSGLGQVYSGLSNIYLKRGFPEKALDYAVLSADAFHQSGEKAYESVAYREIANFYLKLDDFPKAEENANKSFSLATEAGISRYISNALSILAEIYFRQNKFELSIEKSLESLQLDSTDTEIKRILFSNLMMCYINLGKTNQALKYFERYNKEIDTQVDENYQISISEMEVRYETEKKELAIQALQSKKRFNTLAGLSIILIMLIIVIILVFRQKNIISKKKIAEQKILRLKNQKQLIATKAILKGEETERIRLASEIHDGLGGLLTSAKLKLSFLKDHNPDSGNTTELVDNALHLIDNSIVEMRRVAHNLLPETLRHYGLKTAIYDFTNEITPEGLPKIRFSNFGDDLRYKKEVEIMIYRIAQELINNALKYAQASLIDIQLFLEPHRICLQVIDNGIGFETKFLNHFKNGKGIQNIQNRVTAFNGRFEILSEPGKGTECTLEFLIP